MRNVFLSALLLCGQVLSVSAQSDVKDKVQWTLQDAIEYALDHNISIQQNVLNARLAKLNLQQSRLAQLPSLNIAPSYGVSYGRSIDPTTNQFVQGKYSFVSASASSSVLLFGWFQQRNNIAKNKFSLEAARADVEQLRNDVSLNVATGFLRILMAREQIRVNEKQVALSAQQLNQTQKFADVGRVPELNVAQLEAQLASDSATLISAIADYRASILDLKAILNLDFEVPFEAVIPEIPMEDRISLQTLNADYIYSEAVRNIPSIRSSNLKLRAAEKNRDAMRGGLFPQLSVAGQLGSNWTSTYKQFASYSTDGTYIPTGAFVNVGGTSLEVMQPNYVALYNNVPLFRQLDNNFRQTVSATLSIPIFNAWQSQYAYQQARINVQTQELNQYQTELKLKQDVYKAHNDVTNAIQKYYASRRSQEAAQRAFDFAEKRYALGLTNTVEYLVTQNNLYKAEATLLNNKYDLIFKLKVIDYYLGKKLAL
ncbi:TolC family protein [Rurimicrobium arvi]|uniref:TolC family protein n=1 Tax=Rurimicrobium arvi TaxID=2049916 RepID=A0ABP8MXN0_9BACT